jgi:hypothetical protein
LISRMRFLRKVDLRSTFLISCLISCF